MAASGFANNLNNIIEEQEDAHTGDTHFPTRLGIPVAALSWS